MAADIPVTPALAAKVADALEALTHEDVMGRAGPSSPTITKLTRVGGRISPSTAKKVEKALDWEEGTVRATVQADALALVQQARSESQLEALAGRLGVGTAIVKEWKKGKTRIPPDRVEMLFSDLHAPAPAPRTTARERSA